MGILGGLIGGIAGIGQSLIESKTARRNTDMQNTANLNLAKYQYSNEIDMWNRANQYNTPEAQMNRFKSAGLNPNLIYGQGTNGNSPNVLPHYQAPQMRYNYQPSVNLPETLSGFQDMRIKSAQVDNLQAQNKAILLENGIKAYQMDKLGIESQYWGSDVGYGGKYKETDQFGRPYVGTVRQKFEMGNRDLWLKDTELQKTQQDLKQKLLDNAMRDIDLNWYKADKWIGAGSKVIGALGGVTNGLARSFKTNPVTSGELRGVTKYHYK